MCTKTATSLLLLLKQEKIKISAQNLVWKKGNKKVTIALQVPPKSKFWAESELFHEKWLCLRGNVNIHISQNKLKFWAGFDVFYEKWLYLRENAQIRVRAV